MVPLLRAAAPWRRRRSGAALFSSVWGFSPQKLLPWIRPWSKWVHILQITLNSTKSENSVILGQWPQITVDYDTWLVVYGVFRGTELESSMYFALHTRNFLPFYWWNHPSLFRHLNPKILNFLHCKMNHRSRREASNDVCSNKICLGLEKSRGPNRPHQLPYLVQNAHQQ